MVINNKVAFVPIPKNASWSVEDTCIGMGFDLSYPNKLWENFIRINKKLHTNHLHTKIADLIEVYGDNIEYIGIIRNSTDRLISAWKFFLMYMIDELNDETLTRQIKNLDNNFLIEFIKENHIMLKNCYNSDIDLKTELLRKLLIKMGVADRLVIDFAFGNKYKTHIVTFTSQYQWILNNQVKVKTFDFEKLNEFEEYLSNLFDVDFKLLHLNKTKLDYCAVTKTDELMSVVDQYIDYPFTQKKYLI